jgi:hypothetical protein|nr:MAG TPA: hypothetical protein [Caudoviricetes sp.]
MKREELDNILRNLLVAGNIVTVPFEQMREIRKELGRFVKPIQIEIIKSDFSNCFIQRIKII